MTAAERDVRDGPTPAWLTGRRYAGAAITVSYDGRRCLHFAECVRGLPSVFDPTRRPWIDPDGATAGEVAEVVRRCPTGALHYRFAEGTEEQPEVPTRVEALDGGPILVRGDLVIATTKGDVRETRVAFCRCGATTNGPFCDGTCGVNQREGG